MVKCLFWGPYNKALLYGDFRELIEEFAKGNPLAFEPDARKLLAEQLSEPKKPSRTTQFRNSRPYVEMIEDQLHNNPGMSEYRAMKNVLDKLRDDGKAVIDENTLKTYWREYKKALAIKREIIEENQ